MIRRQKSQEVECLQVFDPPITIDRPVVPCGPLILASPHSGRVYPQALIDRSALDLKTLRQNEDAYIDDMLGFARHMDIPLLTARFPRCFVDVNRAVDEVPMSWKKPGDLPSTARAEMGLGVIPTIIADKVPIYKRQLKASCVDDRLEHLYRPYHDALIQLITDAIKTFGQALLLDCHSMPGFTQMGQRRPDIVLGDRHGTSCYPETLARLEALFTAKGYSVARNYPYAGGYVTSHYGRPERNMEVIQIEINRDLYLNPVTMMRKTEYARLADDMKSICWDMLPERRELPLAAE